MLECTDSYKAAIVGDVRRMYIKAILDIVDPDLVYGSAGSSGEAPWSRPEQLHDKTMELDSRDATAEWNRWLLGGDFRLIPDDPQQLTGQIGHVGDVLSDENGVFPVEQYAEQQFSNVSILQACTLFFSQEAVDGIPVDFTVSVRSAGQDIYTRAYTGNREISVSLEGFTVYDPDAVRITVTRWSLPARRMRIAEIIPGLYEEWTEDMLASVDIQMRGNFACLAVPYGICTLQLDNTDRKFEPYSKSGVFQSIEERQAIPIALGVELENGRVEWKQVGVFYQFSGGWRTGNNDLKMKWTLVDIVGLLADRDFVAPATLPKTLAGWLALLVSQLGENFADRWHVDPDYADAAVTANSADDVAGRKCGAILRFACMAAGCWARADAKTGYLTAEPFWSQGNRLDLDNMTEYPTKEDNGDLAVLIFKLYDGEGTIVNISGNATSSSQTLSVDNPFIHTAEQAQTAAKQILSQYGGIKLETTGRGDPASEIGDVDTVWLDASSAVTGRRMEQSLVFSNGVLKNCKSVLLQADGSLLFQNRQVFTASGVFHTGSNTTEVRLILGQGGQGGSPGSSGYVSLGGNLGTSIASGEGEAGLDGHGGKIWSGVVKVNPDTDYAIVIGKGGKASELYGVAGEEGGETTFGVYSSANGQVYTPSYTDIACGSAYGRTGVAVPLAGTGDGGAGGEGGEAGVGYLKRVLRSIQPSDPKADRLYKYELVVVREGGPGKPGIDGADGVCVVYWDKE